jgi:hypothetical protein
MPVVHEPRAMKTFYALPSLDRTECCMALHAPYLTARFFAGVLEPDLSLVLRQQCRAQIPACRLRWVLSVFTLAAAASFLRAMANLQSCPVIYPACVLDALLLRMVACPMGAISSGASFW